MRVKPVLLQAQQCRIQRTCWYGLQQVSKFGRCDAHSASQNLLILIRVEPLTCDLNSKLCYVAEDMELADSEIESSSPTQLSSVGVGKLETWNFQYSYGRVI